MKTSNKIFPAEWHPQSGVMLTWPHPHSDWQPWLEQVEPVFSDIGFHVSQRQLLLVSCWDAQHQEHVERLLSERGAAMNNVRYYLVPSNDTWARDHGPITIINNDRPELIDFTFNGWGGKYESALDNAISRTLNTHRAFGDTPLTSVDLVLEGGSIESDGRGTLLTTENCLLTPTRNPALNKAQIESLLCETLGVERILWLSNGHLEGDDTDSHVDTLARLCNEDTIAYVSCDDPTDVHYTPLKAMEQELQQLRTAAGNAYNLVALPLPKPVINADGARLPATHANFLIINDAVLVPTYGDPNDAVALERLGQCFSDREIIAVDCRSLIMQYGSLHCVTMQLPQGVLV